MPDISSALPGPLFPRPDWYPLAVDGSGRLVRMVKLDEQAYRRAAFLNPRNLGEELNSVVVSLDRLSRKVPRSVRRDAQWIFHISHVGSTLISRLLAETGAFLPLREPQALGGLRNFGPDWAARHLQPIRALLSRVYDSKQRAMVKATSLISEYAAELVGPPKEGGRAIGLTMDPRRFIAARLSGNIEEVRHRASERLERLQWRLPQLDMRSATLDDARLAAMAWATESSSIEAAARSLGEERFRIVDFDDFLAAPAEQLAAIAAYFGAPTDRVAEIAEGPLMARYSKNQARDFSAADREAKIAAALAAQGPAINAAMHWIEGVAAELPELGAALALSLASPERRRSP